MFNVAVEILFIWPFSLEPDFYLKTVCYTWKVMHHYFGTLEQYQDIPRVTLSVNGEQCMCRRVARRIPKYCSSLPE